MKRTINFIMGLKYVCILINSIYGKKFNIVYILNKFNKNYFY